MKNNTLLSSMSGKTTCRDSAPSHFPAKPIVASFFTLLKSCCLIAALLLFSDAARAQWTQVGADINGEAADDRSGYSVSLSSDGTTLAIGAYQNDGNGSNSGHVRVYQFSSGAWTQMGADINGEAAGDWSGFSVSLSSDGTTLAIGATRNDGNGDASGHVRVYQFSGGTWTQMGSDINGETGSNQSGWSVSLSSDGTTLAISAINNFGSGFNSGHVRVYQFSSGTWTQMGADINGEAANDFSGWSVSLSSDGTTVAIGAIQNAGSGHVRVYQFSGGAWTQMGADINGEATGDQSGYSVSLSSDGTTVAIGAPQNDGNGSNSGHVRVYQFSGGAWTQMGADINGEAANNFSGWSVSLSSDGTTVAIGARSNTGNGASSGHVRVYQFSGGAWTQVGADINGEATGDQSGEAVSLSSDGTTVAIGATYNDGNGANSGHVRVYGMSPTQDQDNDGYSLPADCNDANPAVHPGATEICNGVDDDCNTQVDDGLTFQNYYLDGDGDGYGAGTATNACQSPGSNYVTQNGDCNDANAAVNPGATETCNGVDDDCDGSTDEGVLSTFYADTDADGFGDAASTTQACSAPSGYVSNSTDCDDANAAVHPGATETCNGVDDDCDGSTDEGVLSTFYADTDADGFGDAASTTQACSAPSGYVADNTDCDNANAAVHPGATETCNGVDDDCDGSTDEGVLSTFYADTDADGFGDAASTTQACSAPSGYVADNTDCDDTNAAVHPGATETCNGVDDDCDGLTDEGDTDGDGVADCSDNCPTVANADQDDLDLDGIGDACDATLSVCDALGGMVDVIDGNSSIPTTLQNALINKLEQAIEKFQNGNNNGAIGSLNGFVNQVEGQSGNGIPTELADELIAQAEAVIAAIQSGNTNCNSGQSLIVPGGNGVVVQSAEFHAPVLTIFPNPASKQVTFQLDGFERTAAELTLFDLFGRVVWQQKLEEGQRQVTLDVSANLPGNGVYLVRLGSGSGAVTQRLAVAE